MKIEDYAVMSCHISIVTQDRQFPSKLSEFSQAEQYIHRRIVILIS